MTRQSDYPTFDELMARVGLLLLHWGWLETDVRDAGLRVASLADDADIKFARDIRNLVAHGMYSASADENRSVEPFLMCRSVEGDEVRINYSDLNRAMEQISVHRIAVRRRS